MLSNRRCAKDLSRYTIKMRIWFFVFFLIQLTTRAQELYPNSEPASIIPKGALGIRLMNEAYMSDGNFKSWHGAMFMYGLSPKLMFSGMFTTSNHHGKELPANFIHADSSKVDNTNSGINSRNSYLFESVNLGFRYRFLNKDGDHKHFRMALFGNGVYSFNPHDEAEVTLMGDNKGVGGGIISTVLIHKLAVSLTGAVISPFSHRDRKTDVTLKYGHAFNYSLSFGYLVYPFKYKNFNQTNINLYAEFMGKTYNPMSITKNGSELYLPNSPYYTGNSYLEVRPAVQFIIKSNLRIDCSTAIPLVNRSYIRKYPVYLLNLQYYLFL